jgi:Transposase, Mutator family
VTETNVFQLSQPGTFSDPLSEVLRNGARALLAQAVEAEVSSLLCCHADKLTDDGRRRLVRHGHLPEREIMTGIGPVAVRCPRVRDRGGEGCERIRFSSTILPPYARRSKSLEVLIPILYLKGISTGDFEDALIALLGRDASGLSASTIGRLKEAWSEEHARWSKRDLSAKRYIYFWVDGIHVQARLEDTAQCLLIIIGATPEGRKELVGLTDGVRESAQSWRELLLDLKRRGLSIGPELAVADGCACGLRRLRRDLGRQIRQGGRVPDQGSRRVARLLRLSGRALEASAHDECRGKLICYGAPPHRALQRMSLKQDCARHDLQARRGCRKKLASPQWPQPVAENHPRYKVHRRNRGCQIASSSRRRLTPSVTKIRR